MLVAHWPADELPPPQPTVASLGVFDGVHRGHRRVIARTVEHAHQHDRRAVVVTFHRNPVAIVGGNEAMAITSLDHRLRLLAPLGADLCVVLRFDAALAAMPAESFVQSVLLDGLGVEAMVLGPDCRFGHGGAGNAEMCRRMGIDVEVLPPVSVHGREVRSTAIREAIVAGDLAAVESMMGHPFTLLGTVVHGDGRGRALGFPTANLDLHHEAMPPDGVYAGIATLTGRSQPAVVSIGSRRTFHKRQGSERITEVHLLAPCGDIYGQEMELRFVERLRGQIVFNDGDALQRQIYADVERARSILTR
jgi:riboflavin kinase / FMN adenylyltransferase